MALDFVLPRGSSQDDESLGSFVRRRFGREVLERVAQPLIGGIYTADPDYLDAFDQTIESLAAALTDSLMTQWDTRPAYEEMSAGAIERVRSRFSGTDARDRLEQIYERARRPT